jgi:acetyl-CoA synthetase
MNSITEKKYRQWYQQSIDDPQGFWGEQAEKYLSWERKWDTVLTGDFEQRNVRWFTGGMLNASYNCLDRHLPMRAKQAAIIWEGDKPEQTRIVTYEELQVAVCRFANALKTLNVKKGDRVCIYLPMIPEVVVAMLACARIGAIHSVVFSGFSAESLKNRILDADCCLIITTNTSQHGGKTIALKANVDKIINDCPSVRHVVVVDDDEYDELIKNAATNCPPLMQAATDPLFILYTSGSTGHPKGILHGTGGYLLYATMTFQLVFDYREGEVFWCTADVGWITGHSYVVYGPLASGATILMFAGTPNYPSPSRFWQVIDKHRVNVFYTAPTAIRALMRLGDHHVQAAKRDSLRLLGSVGEPLNPEVWEWYFKVVGDERCPIVDTWWQTETGGIMITALPYTTPLKPGAVSWPFFGVSPAIVDDDGKLINQAEITGNLVITKPWPGQLQTIYNDHDRFIETYFGKFNNFYFTGDGAFYDEENYFWITGRVDDVINVSGHRLDTAEIESAIVSHPKVAEAAVVGCPHALKGQGIYAFVTPKVGVVVNDDLYAELVSQVRDKIGALAKPDYIQWTEDLPKTRSGKIMRRLLRKIVNGETQNLGDISTLSNPEIIDKLIDRLLIK